MTESLAIRLHRLELAVRSAGGAARTSSLVNQGHSRHVVSSAVAEGRAVRPRKGWVALPTSDQQIVDAVRAGVVLTCVTQARRLGLWVLADHVPHVGASRHSGSVVAARSRVHWMQPPVQRHPDALVDSIENVLAIVATCQPHDIALAVRESAVRKGLVDLDAMRRLELPSSARMLCEEATPWSDSGLESFVIPRLRWMRVPIVPQAWIAGHRVDFLIGDRLVLQIDGGHHVGAQREADLAHDAQLMLMGYHVVRVGYAQVVERWPEVQDVLMRAIAQGLHEVA